MILALVAVLMDEFFDQSVTLKAQKSIICSQCCQLPTETNGTSLCQFFLDVWPRNMLFEILVALTFDLGPNCNEF